MQPGEVFHRLTVVSVSGRYGIYRCACGNEKRIWVTRVRTGKTKSCGCLRKEVTSERNRVHKTTHGMTNTRVYPIWSAMLKRCTNPSEKDRKYYGGRGINICDTWREFENFYADMGDPPTGLTLERRDNNQGYSAANCYWATQTEQNNNRRNSVRITFNGLTLNPTQWAEKLGIPRRLIYARRHRGMSVEEVLAQPLNLRTV